jgi:hypothetical protein
MWEEAPAAGTLKTDRQRTYRQAMYFDRGSSVVIRDLNPHGGFIRALPARVVEDNENRTVLYVAAGNIYSQPNWLGSGVVKKFFVDDLEELTWERHSILRFMYPNTPYSIWVLFDDIHHQFERWYINIEMEYVRSQIGFDTRDYELDIVVNPDLSWKWKDEAELRNWVDQGVFTKTQASDFRRYGLDVVSRLDPRNAPFTEEWKNWQPDSDWGLLKLPPDSSEWLV